MSAALYPACPVLLVDDESDWLRSMAVMLERLGGINNLVTCDDSRKVTRLLSEREYCLVLLDYTMPHLSGVELLAQIGEEHPGVPVIILTGRDQVETAVECIRLGAIDYFVKTMEDERLVAGLQRAIRMQELARENSKLREGIFRGELDSPAVFADIVARSPIMKNLFHYVEAIAASNQPVLITGESGVGKELLAKAIHRASRPNSPWVPVNVAGIDDAIFDDTMFGHVSGDGDDARKGMVEKAQDGVLFLDEIGSLNPASQSKLLRLLQDGEYYPLGSDWPKRLAARVVVATNQDLGKLQDEGTFRKDLFYRLKGHHLHIPPLRERNEDLPVLLDHFLSVAADELGKTRPTPPGELLTLLATYNFPGNVRELRYMVFDAVALHQGRKLSMDAFKRAMGLTSEAVLNGGAAESSGGKVSVPLNFDDDLPTIKDAIQSLIEEAMNRADGNQGIAASMLGLSRPALNKRLKKITEE